MTETTQPRKIVVAGACVFGDCDCKMRDGLRVDGDRIPPFHDGCTCCMVEIKEADTQPKPGRPLDERMAEVMGWPMLEPFSNWGEKFPCAARGDLGDDLKAWIYDAPRLAREWNPSTRIADAFEVMSREGFRWFFEEQESSLHLILTATDSSGPETTGEMIVLYIPWSDFTDPDGTRNRPEAYSFGICWAALVWLEGQGDGRG